MNTAISKVAKLGILSANQTMRMTAIAALLMRAAIGGETLSLNGEWRLDYWNQPYPHPVRALPLPDGLDVKTVMAQVPGNCELDLVNAGLLPPPEIGLNVLKLRPYEGCQWLYTKTFVAPVVPTDGSRAILTFGGIDTLADIFFNGEKIGETENMFIPHRFDVTKRLKPGANTVQVLIRSLMMEAQHKTIGILGYCMDGGADGEPFRKAGHMGGWDIFPRVFASGLWREVSLEVEGPVRIDQVAWLVSEVNPKAKTARVGCRARIQAPFSHIGHATVRYVVSRGRQTLLDKTNRLDTFHVFSQSHGTPVKAAEFWWPRGWGEPALYDAAIEVRSEDGTLLARDMRKIGLRTIRLEYADIYPDRPGQFLFRVNGKPCYIRGTNWVPLDSFHGRDMRHLLPTLDMVADLNCNMIRVWGGGVYETDAFFDYCDAHGIMVWQDFMTGCSVFPQDDEYARLTRIETLDVVHRFRNRASLALWSGNNENDGAFYWKLGYEFGKRFDPNDDRNSRKTIKDVIWEYDVMHDYLPSSPYVSRDVFLKKATKPEGHLWGARGYYKVPFYTNSPCLFASEMGYHGCPNRASLERMMTPDCVYPWKKGAFEWNDEWQTKACNAFGPGAILRPYRNGLMTNQVAIMFGKVPRELDTFIAQSQTVQAEAMKTFVEIFRSDKFAKKNGLIWWNVRDGWPIISDAVVDYYGGRKRAYYAIRRVQQNQLVMVRDDRRVMAVNDRLHPVKGHVRITDKATGKIVFDTDYSVPANAVCEIGTVAWDGAGVLAIAWNTDGEQGHNHYLYGMPPYDWATVAPLLEGEYK